MTYTITDITELVHYHLVLSVRTTRRPTTTSVGSSTRSRVWQPHRSGNRPSGSSVTAAARASTRCSSTRTATTTPTRATSTALTAGRPDRKPDRPWSGRPASALPAGSVSLMPPDVLFLA